MYAKYQENRFSLDEISLVKVEGEEAFRLQRQLDKYLDLLHNNNNAKYQLTINISKENFSLGVLKNRETTRYRVKVHLNYILKDSENKKIISQDTLSLYSSYNSADSQFANYSANIYVANNVLRELAEELKLRLSLVLEKQR